jgi:hypothetical protein
MLLTFTYNFFFFFFFFFFFLNKSGWEATLSGGHHPYPVGVVRWPPLFDNGGRVATLSSNGGGLASLSLSLNLEIIS